MGIAFVAFTTQFGGGFASGAQIYQYFINYGIWCLLMPLITQGLYALFFWYGMRYAYKHKTYDYRSFSDSLYGKTRPIMSNLYEICYLIMIGTASSCDICNWWINTSNAIWNPILGMYIDHSGIYFRDRTLWNKCRKKMCIYFKCTDLDRISSCISTKHHRTVGCDHSDNL